MTELVEQVELFPFFGQFGCIKNLREFIFCVHDNGTHSALVQPISGNKSYGEDWKDEYASYHLHYGVLSGHTRKNEASNNYDVKFVIGTWRDIIRPRMICMGRLTVSGMTGAFRYSKGEGRSADLSESEADIHEDVDVFDNGEEEVFPFELLACSHLPSKRLENSFLPLVPGYYELCGSDQTNWLAITETDVFVELYSDGTLAGNVVQCRGQYTEFTIMGMWKPDEICFTTKHFCETPFTFVGTPSASGLRGFWRRCEGYRPRTFEKESAVFDLKLANSFGRLWCKELHPYTPQEFRQSVRYMRLSSLRDHTDPTKVGLPSDLW